MKYFIKTFGCQQNIADSERLAGYYENRGFSRTENYDEANLAVINTCVIRQKSEDKAYGLIKNLDKARQSGKNFKIVVTGCLVGTAIHDKTGKMMRLLKRKLPEVDEFLPSDEVGFENNAIRQSRDHAWVPISNGCNNFCSFCIVPFSRGREKSRPFDKIIDEINKLTDRGYTKVTLLGQNVNSYGADLVVNNKKFASRYNLNIKPVTVKHLGRYRLATLFPPLLKEICKNKKIKNLSFVSSNPWDFSEELIETIAGNEQIDRIIHLPVQSGSNRILKVMNRWYTKRDYLELIKKIKSKIHDCEFTTDIIVGFPGETEKDFLETLDLVKKVHFTKAFIACFSARPNTLAAKLVDNVTPLEKKKRFHILDKYVNHRPNIKIPIWLKGAPS